MALDFLNESQYVRTENVDVGEAEPAEVEVRVLQQSVPPTHNTDPFLRINVDALPTNLKRKVNRITKATKEQVGSKAKTIEVPSAYDVMQIVAPPYDMDMLAKLYETNGAHNAAVTMKSVNICGLGYEWVESKEVQMELEKMLRDSANAAKPPAAAADTGLPQPQPAPTPVSKKYLDRLDELRAEKIALDEQLDSLNPDEEFNEIMTKIWTDVESLGNGFLEVGRNRKGEVKFIGHIAGQTMRVRAKRDGFVQFVSNQYTFFRNYGDQEALNPLQNDPRPNEVMQFKKYSPTSSFYGVPDIVAALTAALGDKFAREYNLDYFENKAVPRYVFLLKGAKLSPKSEEVLVNYFKNEIKGKHHGTLYIPIPAGFGQQVEAEFKAIEVGVQEGSFAKFLQENRQEILMVHRVPPGKVGVYNNANLAISRDADKTFKEQVCRPEQRRVSKKLNKIVGELTTTFTIKFQEADIIDEDIQSRIDDRYLRTQVLVPNDVRRRKGLPARPDGNDPLPFMRPVAGAAPQNNNGPGQKTSDGARPTRATPPDATGQRQQRGQAQDAGRRPNDPSKVKQ